MMRPDNPLIVQSDRSLMLHTVTSVVDAQGRPVKDAQGRPTTREHPRFFEKITEVRERLRHDEVKVASS